MHISNIHIWKLEGEKKASGWLLILACIICAKFDGPTQDTLFTPAQQHLVLSDQQKHKTIAEKLVDFADSLSLNPYDEMVTSQLHFNLCHITPSALFMSLHLIHQLV